MNYNSSFQKGTHGWFAIGTQFALFSDINLSKRQLLKLKGLKKNFENFSYR